MNALQLVTPITQSLVSAFRPITSRVAPLDGRPAEMTAPRLAADLVPQVYRPGSASLMRTAPILSP